MKWKEICIYTANEAVDAVANILHEAGSNGVAIVDSHDLERVENTTTGAEIYELNPDDYPKQGVLIKGYLPMTNRSEQTVQEITRAFHELADIGFDLGEKRLYTRVIHEQDWATAWKQYYKPIHVSEKVTIAPTWKNYKPENANEFVIELDPGMAFGTGTHPTTAMCLQALELTITSGDLVIDVGTGSGVLSIAAALFGARHVFACDLDEVAVKRARENITLNKQEDKITVQKNDLLRDVHLTADVIVANLLAETVLRLAPAVINVLQQGGYFIASGIIKNQQEPVVRKLVALGFNVEETLEKEDWVAIIAKRTG